MKNIIFLASLTGLLVLSACKITTGTGSGGSGGDPTGPGGGGFGGVGGGPGGGPPCVSCAEAITDGTADLLCPGTTSEQLYLDLEDCLCAGVCSPWCGDNLCQGFDSSIDCDDCIQDTSPDGCGQAYNDCSNDF